MRIATNQVFPGLEKLISGERYGRVNSALHALFNRTIQEKDDGLPFIITGDIPAMWLRDSTWQVKPLLSSKNSEVIELLINLSKSQVKLFLCDPYANAFNPSPNGNCWHKDFDNQSPWVFERKFELDSWASILYLSREIIEKYGRTDHITVDYKKAVNLMLELAKKEQSHDPESYVFLRENTVPHDYLSHNGKGAPTAYTGMVFSGFRPSDDACKYGFHIPSNFFFANELDKLPLADEFPVSNQIAREIFAGIENFGVKDGIYAYEVDGLGRALFMDDANVPSLLSLPYLGVTTTDNPQYRSTREFILSKDNPFYFSGKKVSGIGSQHTPNKHVWPIAIAMEALTSDDKNFQAQILSLLENTDAGTRRMHESFHVDDASVYTREWFSWSDMTYVDLVLASVNYRYQ